MLFRGQKMKGSCPRGEFRTWSSIGGVRIFNAIAQCCARARPVNTIADVYRSCARRKKNFKFYENRIRADVILSFSDPTPRETPVYKPCEYHVCAPLNLIGSQIFQPRSPRNRSKALPLVGGVWARDYSIPSPSPFARGGV